MLLGGGVGVGAGVVATVGVAALVAVPIVPGGGSVAVGLALVAPPVVEVGVVSASALVLVAVEVPSDGLIVHAASEMESRSAATSATMPVRNERACRGSSLVTGCRCDMFASFRVVVSSRSR
jgi:hypothetical protein